MSSEVKYIGMDVHKEAIVNAVCNSTGQLVMDSIVETKASSILQFIQNEAIAWLQWIGKRNDRRAEPEKPRMGGIRTKNSARARLLLIVDTFGSKILPVPGLTFRCNSRDLAITGYFSYYFRNLFPALLQRSFHFSRTDSLQEDRIGSTGRPCTGYCRIFSVIVGRKTISDRSAIGANSRKAVTRHATLCGDGPRQIFWPRSRFEFGFRSIQFPDPNKGIVLCPEGAGHRGANNEGQHNEAAFHQVFSLDLPWRHLYLASASRDYALSGSLTQEKVDYWLPSQDRLAAWQPAPCPEGAETRRNTFDWRKILIALHHPRLITALMKLL